MGGRYFLDTNVLVYTFDDRAPAKQRRARKLVAEALETRRGLVSTQVVQEFLNVARSWASARRAPRRWTPRTSGPG